MAETTATSTPKSRTPRKPRAMGTSAGNGNDEAKAKFAKALDEARAGAQALGKQAQEKAGIYREKLAGNSDAWMADAKVYGTQAKDKAVSLANDGKSRASDALSGIGKIVADNAPAIDEKLGVKYGDYARSAARSMQEAAAKIEAKDINELGNDARELIRKSPGLAIGMAAVAGFMLARMFKGSED
jgi:hypothetical protein